MSGIWLEAAVTRAWIAGRENATSEVGAAVYAPTPASATASARTELASLTGAMACVVLWSAESAVVAHMTPSQAWKKISAAFDSATKDKAVAFANRTITVPSGPGEFHPEPLTDSGLDTLASSGSCHRTKAAAFR